MKTLREQTEQQVNKGRINNPTFMATVDQIIAEAKAVSLGEKALQVGDEAIDFYLPDQNTNKVRLTQLLAKGPVVLTFYRGSWCPYCNLQLKSLEQNIDAIHELNASLVAISPQVPDPVLDKNEIQTVNFSVLSDQDASTAKLYGVSWQVPDFLLAHLRNDRNLDLESLNNGNGSVLPVPATYVISKEGKIVWRYLDIDYRQRAETSEIIEALKQL